MKYKKTIIIIVLFFLFLLTTVTVLTVLTIKENKIQKELDEDAYNMASIEHIIDWKKNDDHPVLKKRDDDGYLFEKKVEDSDDIIKNRIVNYNYTEVFFEDEIIDYVYRIQINGSHIDISTDYKVFITIGHVSTIFQGSSCARYYSIPEDEFDELIVLIEEMFERVE